MDKCERCGNKRWDNNGNAGTLKMGYKRFGIVAGLISFFAGNYDGYHYSETSYELCEDCRKELEKWLRGKDYEKNT